MNELVISPIHFESWPHLVRITALFKDKPGVVRKLAHAVREEFLDVMYEESATIESGRFHRAEFLASAKIPYEQHASRALPPDELLPKLERKFQAICLNELSLANGIPRLKVRQMEGLRNAYFASREYADTRKMSTATYAERTLIEDKHIRIPNSILEHLGDAAPRAILISDTRDRVLRVLIPSKKTYFTYVRVGHLDRIGSLFRIANALSEAFTAVVTLTRLKRQGSKNDVEFLLYTHTYPHKEDESRRREIIESILASRDLEDLFIRVSYPTRAGDVEKEDEAKKPRFTGVHVLDQAQLVPLEGDLCALDINAILDHRISQYSAPSSGDHDPERASRLDAARLLYSQEQSEAVPSPQVFISYNFDRQELFDTVSRVIQEDGDARVICGKNPDNHGKPFRDKIRDRIRCSQGFIAIWGENAKSPWLIWELGVAQAYGIPVAVFPHAKLKEAPHLSLLSELHCEPFLDVELREKFIAKWKHFKREMAAYDKTQLALRVLKHN